MDIAAKKIELMDWLLHINDESKLKKIIALKSVLDKEVVAHTISGYPVDKEEYINMVKEADERISSGKYTTIEDLEKEIDKYVKFVVDAAGAPLPEPTAHTTSSTSSIQSKSPNYLAVDMVTIRMYYLLAGGLGFKVD